MNHSGTSITVIFAVYLFGMLGIGAYFYRKTSSLSDYILGGRKMNKWVISLSAQASDMSGWLLMGLPGLAYLTGLSEAFWVALGLALGTWLNWRLVAARLRTYTQVAGDSLTISDYLANRFEDKHNLLRAASSIFILVFFLVYTASGFVAGGKLFATVFNIDYTLAVFVGAMVIISYTFMGGFLAVCWTDFIQGILMFLAVITVPLAAMFALGGPIDMFSRIHQADPNLLNIFTDMKGQSLGPIAIISAMAWGLGYFGMPHILVRFMAIDKASNVKHSRRTAMIWVVFSLAAALLIGLTGKPFLAQTLEGAASEKVFMLMVGQIFPVVIAGILLAAILAAVMSTADSQLLVTASSIAEDFYRAMFRREATETELVWVGRITVVAIAMIAFFMSLDPESSVFRLVSFAWAGLGATFGPVILLSLFWRRMNWRGALCGMLSGGITVIIWKQLDGGLWGIFDIYEIVPGFIIAILAIIITSLTGPEPSARVIADFDKTQELMKEI